MKRQVVDYVQGANDPELLDVAGRSLNMAIDEINLHAWKKLTGAHYITLSVNQADYALKSDFRDPAKCELLDSSGNPRRRLMYKDFETMQIEHPDGGLTGSPNFYTIYYSERLVTLERLPNQAFIDQYPTMRLRHYRRIPYLEGQLKLDAPSEFSLFVVWTARAELAAIRGESRSSLFATNKAGVVMRRLLSENYDTQTDWSEY